MARPANIAIRNLKPRGGPTRAARRRRTQLDPDPIRSRGQRPLTFAAKAVTSKVAIILTRRSWSSVLSCCTSLRSPSSRATM
jgi:hypothetical protein